MKIFELKGNCLGILKGYLCGHKIFSKNFTKNSKYPKLIKFFADYYEVAEYLEKYKYVLKETLPAPVNSNIGPDKVWRMWFQGVDNAPEVVKLAFASQDKYIDREIITLTENTIKDYVDIPDYMYEKYKSGAMYAAAYSDYVRLKLLYNYGGTYMDATILMTDKMPDYIWGSDLFVYHYTPELLGGILMPLCSSFFHCSSKGNPLIGYMIRLHEEYWKNEDTQIHYSMIHLLWRLAITNNEECKKIWQQIPKYYDVIFHTLQIELFDKYDPKRFEQICAISPLHKLCRMFEYNEAEHKGSYFEYLIKNYREKGEAV